MATHILLERQFVSSLGDIVFDCHFCFQSTVAFANTLSIKFA